MRPTLNHRLWDYVLWNPELFAKERTDKVQVLFCAVLLMWPGQFWEFWLLEYITHAWCSQFKTLFRLVTTPSIFGQKCEYFKQQWITFEDGFLSLPVIFNMSYKFITLTRWTAFIIYQSSWLWHGYLRIFLQYLLSDRCFGSISCYESYASEM